MCKIGHRLWDNSRAGGLSPVLRVLSLMVVCLAVALSSFLSINLAGTGSNESPEVVRMTPYKWANLGVASLAQVAADVSLIAFTAPGPG